MRHSGLLYILLFLLGTFQLNAQTLDHLTVPFEVNGQELENPLIGGFNDPQFSSVDLNDDGTLDLFVYDRIGNVALTFINNGTSNQVDYTYAPEYSKNFPKVTNWALMRDYDNDGIMDLFASAPPGLPGVIVFSGYYEAGKIAFNQVPFNGVGSNVVPFETSGGLTNIYVSSQDIPAIDDVDGDGDLDILSFGVNGGYIFHHENRSVERGFGTDSLQFVMKTTCLGGVYESGLSGCICWSLLRWF